MNGEHNCVHKQGLVDESMLGALMAGERSTMLVFPVMKKPMGQSRSNNGGLNTYSRYAMIGPVCGIRESHMWRTKGEGPCMLIDREEKEVHSDTHCVANVQHGIRRFKGSKSMCQRAKREPRSRSPKRSQVPQSFVATTPALASRGLLAKVRLRLERDVAWTRARGTHARM